MRNYQISIFLKLFQIPNGYVQHIGFLNSVSNQIPEKGAFEKIKRANP
jgi:hypothetical protein